MKRMTFAAGIAALAVTLTGCGSSTTKAADTTAAAAAADPAATETTMAAMDMIDKCEVHGEAGSIKLATVKADELSLVTSLPAPGWFNGADPASVKDGYEYCMAAQIAHLAGLKKVSLVSVNFDQLVAGVTTDYDIGLAETSITEKRKLVIDFSDPYFASDIGLLADAKNADTYKDTAGLKDAVIGVQQDTTGAQFIQDNLKDKVKEIKVLPDSATLFTALTAGQITLAATDTSIVQEQEKKGAGALKVIGQFKTGESYGVILPKGSANTAEINKAIQMMTADGTFAKLGTTYLSGDPGSVPVFTP
jgi:polar amino acid transport system substrate-binding protein